MRQVLEFLQNSDYSTVLQQHEAFQDRYGTDLDKLPKRYQYAAEAAFYADSGHVRRRAPTAEDSNVRDSLTREILAKISPDMKGNVRALADDLSIDRIRSGGCCGKRNFYPLAAHTLNPNDCSFSA